MKPENQTDDNICKYETRCSHLKNWCFYSYQLYQDSMTLLCMKILKYNRISNHEICYLADECTHTHTSTHNTNTTYRDTHTQRGKCVLADTRSFKLTHSVKHLHTRLHTHTDTTHTHPHTLIYTHACTHTQMGMCVLNIRRRKHHTPHIYMNIDIGMNRALITFIH